MRCVIIDDEPLALDLLESYVNKTPILTLEGKFSSAILAIEQLKENPVDLVFLDIQMPLLNGLEFARLINPEQTRVVFTTAFEQYAIDGYKVNALDYLLKPITYSDFLQAVHKAFSWYEIAKQPKNERKTIIVKSDYKQMQIEIDKILYVEGLKDYIKIYVHEQPKPILTLMSMKSMEELLPPSKFMRIHRSFIVNKNRINVIDKSRLIIEKSVIPVSESYKSVLTQFLNERS